MLRDIELIVDRSTTYRAVGANARSYVDRTGDAAPQGPPAAPAYALFMRQRADERAFRECVRTLARRWSAFDGVLRVRMSLFEVPDMEAERKAGYPIRTHPAEQQYQATVEIVLSERGVGRELLGSRAGVDWAGAIGAIHAYPIAACYTSVYAGRPTLAGLRGYAAHQAIRALGADNQTEPGLLEWMYGAVARGGASGEGA